MSTDPKRKVQFERKPSTRYARRQSHLLREVQLPSNQIYSQNNGVIHRMLDPSSSHPPNPTFISSPQLNTLTTLSQSHTLQNAIHHTINDQSYQYLSQDQLNKQRQHSLYSSHQQISTAGLTNYSIHPQALPVSSNISATRSIVDIISEFNAKNEHLPKKKDQAPPPPPRPPIHLNTVRDTEPDIDYLKWVSESRQTQSSKLTPTESCSSAKSGSIIESESSGDKIRTSSPDSGCEMSVMVAYTSEPKVRRPDHTDTSSDTDSEIRSNAPVPAPRQSIRKSKSDLVKSSSDYKPKTVQVTNIEHPPMLSVKQINQNTPLECPFSRTGIYSLEGSRLNCLGNEQPRSELEHTDSGRGSSIPSEEESSRTIVMSGVNGDSIDTMDSLQKSKTMRSYASSRDILEMYGQGAAGHSQPLTPRLVGFSSYDLRLPPAAMLLSLSG